MFIALITCVASDSNAGHSVLHPARSAVTGSCASDGVHIIRGSNFSSAPFATVCGDEILSPVTILGPVLLNFYSNAHTTDLGFKFNYKITRE